MSKIYLLTDYLDRFGSKHNSYIYKGGMDKDVLRQFFYKFGYKVEFLPIYKVDFRSESWEGKLVLYSSQEDVGGYYKSFVEDVVYGLELAGAVLVPPYKYLKAHNNKVFMEMLRDLLLNSPENSLKATSYGSFEEAMIDEKSFVYPVVLKSSEGAMSKNVALVRHKMEFEVKLKKMAASRNRKEEVRELVRSYRYPGYKKQSKFRRKFIVQPFLPGLPNDWKILVFGDKFYIVERFVRKRDFRASGGGFNLFGSKACIPRGIFSYAKEIKDKLGLPMVSLDIAKTESGFHIIEFQAVYFGTSGQWKSDCYYKIDGDEVVPLKNDVSIEEVYVESIVDYLDENSFCRRR